MKESKITRKILVMIAIIFVLIQSVCYADVIGPNREILEGTFLIAVIGVLVLFIPLFSFLILYILKKNSKNEKDQEAISKVNQTNKKIIRVVLLAMLVVVSIYFYNNWNWIMCVISIVFLVLGFDYKNNKPNLSKIFFSIFWCTSVIPIFLWMILMGIFESNTSLL